MMNDSGAFIAYKPRGLNRTGMNNDSLKEITARFAFTVEVTRHN